MPHGGSPRTRKNRRLWCAWMGEQTLPGVRLSEPVDELIVIAGLGQVALLEQLAQLGFGHVLVPLARALMKLPAPSALNRARLTSPFLVGPLGLLGLLAGGCRGPGRFLASGLLDRARPAAHEHADYLDASSHDVPGCLGSLPHGIR